MIITNLLFKIYRKTIVLADLSTRAGSIFKSSYLRKENLFNPT
tara:strand:+ start:493 stop:621 length:129 start_codon:yes stop_codon:yes gene_type:complete